ncbi:phospholipase D-like domain-containing anti-phage protein [Siccirubricoccus sp. G192]|uniref:phospholipase D-like domain-containing anti-phage protein n=1 Tax=Siccirubricoccus sp. G192 TaxID=2849651 RepID=UPI001C2BE6DF|nr:phospholipase D-like domain-containing anti-phage protein [Siccirubricoccus sp. G192]MBV1800653.1 DEAD/DEAH box helicase family protein [Siccirubricoccus sp. G192]MBV1800718.1 DEAD/DEAH box helicase family protein [Siccirubricoccus sp. G192]
MNAPDDAAREAAPDRGAGILRFSSRRQRLDHAFLRDRLRGAQTYDRIAGYFRSSIFEVAAEELATVGRIRVVCNSDLNPQDIHASKEARTRALVQRWWEGSGEAGVAVETLLNRNRYVMLRDLLQARDANGGPKVTIKVVDRLTAPLVHGKAGIITLADGSKTCFMGSVNETREAWQDHYELIWEDPSPEAIGWTQEEFDFLWDKAVPLPDAVISEIARCAARVEIRLPDCPPWDERGTTDIARAVLAEAPLVRAGEGLQPWQKAFVSEFLRQREVHGKARLLLADEVGVGKTLSMATSALVTALLGDGPALILAPATLCEQWQTELIEKLGVPSARWISNRKEWMDHRGHVIPSRPEDIVRSPYKVAIVSTGLVMRDSVERKALLERRARPGESPYGIVILDEAHKARGSATPSGEREPNNLLQFMSRIALKARHVILGTATPIQTDPMDLWDLMKVLGSGADHVLGDDLSRWRNRPEDALRLIRGEVRPRAEADAWEWLRNPLPPGAEREALFGFIRQNFGMPDTVAVTDRSPVDLDEFYRQDLADRLTHDPDGRAFFQEHNPVVRHTVLRRRRALEEAGLMKPVAVDLHPRDDEPDRRTRAFFGATGKAVIATIALQDAFKVADAYTSALMSRNKGAGFLKSLLLQRICSSSTAGLSTMLAIARRSGVAEAGPDEQPTVLGADDDDEMFDLGDLGEASTAERNALRELLTHLRRAQQASPTGADADPKLQVLRHYLKEAGLNQGRRGWLDAHGCIIFSQYYDTAKWVADCVAAEFPAIPVGLYAGAGRSGIYKDGQFASTDRNVIKTAVRNHELRLLVATDAACEGLNLQTLGTLVNIDLPWNPSKLEQRIGRIKRFGQVRDRVDMLSLVYEGSRDEVVYDRLSERMKDRFDIFGQLPDTLDDDWIENEETLEAELRKHADRKRQASAFDVRWGGTATGEGATEAQRSWQRGWETCTQVLARQDVEEVLCRGW